MKSKPNPNDVHYAAAVFKALGHPERLRIVCALAERGTCTQTQLVETLGRPQSTLARHLAPLRALGLVSGERDGLEVPLHLSSALTQELLDAVCGWIHPADRRARSFGHLMSHERESA
ncbi:MAG TPA: metalloregulator ArsR/SmtB family transcription factor [Longimicrobiales bacterium]